MQLVLYNNYSDANNAIDVSIKYIIRTMEHLLGKFIITIIITIIIIIIIITIIIIIFIIIINYYYYYYYVFRKRFSVRQRTRNISTAIIVLVFITERHWIVSVESDY